jgi:acetylornithine aminotransferase
VSTNEQMQARWASVMQSNYGPPTIALDHGSGAEVWDVEGRRYVDLLAGIATNLLGHAHPVVIDAVTAQVARLGHISNLYMHEPGLALAEKLSSMAGGGRVFFCNSGAEANEAAFKLSRLTGRRKVVAAENAFHGRTMGALALTGQPTKAAPFQPLPGDVTHVPFGDIEAMRTVVDEHTAMVIVEPIQGEAGVVVPPAGYLGELRALTRQHGALLAVDEVQTGMGRTGSWFAFQHEGIEPDVITMAKGLGAGLPLGAMIARGAAADLLTAGSHGSTFGGNPLSTAAGLAAIHHIESQGLLTRVATLGTRLEQQILALASPLVASVRGAGLLRGVVFAEPIAGRVNQMLLERGFLANAAAPDVVRLAPPLTITEELLDEFVAVFREILQEVPK